MGVIQRQTEPELSRLWARMGEYPDTDFYVPIVSFLASQIPPIGRKLNLDLAPVPGQGTQRASDRGPVCQRQPGNS